jgi:hypothetical protein
MFAGYVADLAFEVRSNISGELRLIESLVPNSLTPSKQTNPSYLGRLIRFDQILKMFYQTHQCFSPLVSNSAKRPGLALEKNLLYFYIPRLLKLANLYAQIPIGKFKRIAEISKLQLIAAYQR